MRYRLLYVEDQEAESRAASLRKLGYDVETFNPSSDIGELLEKVSNINALILDYRLTEGENNACFDAPTIAQTIRSKHSNSHLEFPIILMSNEEIITNYYTDFTSQDLFDFVLSKQNFNNEQNVFACRLNSFIKSYSKVKESKFDILKILGLKEDESFLLDVHIKMKTEQKTFEEDVFAHVFFTYKSIIRYSGCLISRDILYARLGISKENSDSEELKELEKKMRPAAYSGILADIEPRWWMQKVKQWWEDTLKIKEPLRRLSATERVDLLKRELSLNSLVAAEPDEFQESSNFWTVCIESKRPLDPFEGIEIIQDYSPWQEKKYLSIKSALEKMKKYKNKITSIDKKYIMSLVKN